jgi:hypothetical protein
MTATITGGITYSGGGFSFTPPSNDPYFMYNTLLLPGNGANNATNSTFVDTSTNNFPITRYGNTTQGTFTPFGGNWSNYFNGSTDYLKTPTNTAFTFGTGDLTLECWIFQTATSTSAYKVLFADNVYGGAGGYTLYSYNNALNLWKGGSPSQIEIIAPAGTITLNSWTHVAWTRSGSSNRLFINGTQVGATTSDSTNYTGTISYIGASVAATLFFPGYISNARILKGTALYTTNFIPSTTPLTAISNTSLLTCQSNSFIDNSNNIFALTVTGSPAVQRFSPFSPSSFLPTSYSNYFNGSTDYATVPSNAVFSFGTGDFSIEFWLNPIGAGDYFQQHVFQTRDGVNNGILFQYDRTNKNISVISDTGLTGLVTGNNVINDGTWYHVACTRSGTTVYFFVNGVLIATTTSAQNFNATTPYISRRYASDGFLHYFNGYISNIRVVKGVAVYTSAFTPPINPLTAITGTSLLTCQSNTFIDNSTNNFTISVFGSPKIITQNPFGYTTGSLGYSSSAIGGSGYFDGTGDYLTIPDSSAFALGTSNFTIEAWIYPTATGNYPVIASQFQSGGGAGSFFWSLGPTATPKDVNFYLYYSSGSTVLSASNVVVLNTWNHHAVVRNSNTLIYYLNGISVATVAFSNTVNDSASLFTVGNGGDTGYTTYPFTGYISNLRFIKGTVLYTSNFSPSTAPLPVVTNTSLLCNFSNIGILDNSMMYNLETTSDTQLSTTQTKFGNTSISFNSGYVTNQTKTLLYAYGTGDFTVETWFYLATADSGYKFLVDTYDGAYGVSIRFGNSGFGNKLQVATNQNTLPTVWSCSLTQSAALNAWYHVALVRQSGVCKLYLNGTLQSIGNGANPSSYPNTSFTSTDNIGSSVLTLGTFVGYLSNVRFTKGYARYTSNFTAPTAAFPLQ